MNFEEVADVLERAADAIEVHGLGKGTYQNKQGNLCAVGALRYAATGETYTTRAALDPRVTLATRILANRVDVFGSPLPSNRVFAWNDHKKRTAAEVVDAMKMASKDLRNQT